MTVGILSCDRVRPALLDIQGEYPDMFRALLPELDMQVFYVCENEFPTQVEVCDAWLVTGSRHSVYDDIDWIKHLQEFVRQIQAANLPYVGLCFGHQLLAQSLGGQVTKSEHGWCVGIHSFELLDREDWMNPFQDTFNLPMMCQDQVLQLPPDSTVLATSPQCPIGMFRVGERMLGIQAHPEFSKAYDRALMLTREDRIGAEKIAAAEASFAVQADQKITARYITNFFKQFHR